MKRVIVINPRTKEITEQFLARGRELESMQAYVGGFIELAPIYLPLDHAMYVNEEGLLLKGLDSFHVEGARYPLVGSALIIGKADDEGDHVGATLSVEQVAAFVKFGKA